MPRRRTTRDAARHRQRGIDAAEAFDRVRDGIVERQLVAHVADHGDGLLVATACRAGGAQLAFRPERVRQDGIVRAPIDQDKPPSRGSEPAGGVRADAPRRARDDGDAISQ